jgi:hypothetical protein
MSDTSSAAPERLAIVGSSLANNSILFKETHAHTIYTLQVTSTHIRCIISLSTYFLLEIKLRFYGLQCFTAI